MLDVRYSHLYFYQSLNRLQCGLSAIAELVVGHSHATHRPYSGSFGVVAVKINKYNGTVAEFHSMSDRYSSLFGLRSFGQAWHWFKESRRANCVALHSFLTFIMLPWHRIVAGVLFSCTSTVLFSSQLIVSAVGASLLSEADYSDNNNNITVMNIIIIIVKKLSSLQCLLRTTSAISQV